MNEAAQETPESVPGHDAHTQIPNLVYDIVLWLVDPAERDCLLYIVRRTHGFVDGQGNRKARDMISLDQFANGIATGDVLCDLGINRTRNTIRKALRKLHDKGLIDVRQSCAKCRWQQPPEQSAGAPGNAGPACPRCKATTSYSYALAELTPQELVKLLNAHDPKGRKFHWDGRHFRFEVAAENADRPPAPSPADQINAIRKQLWHPELVDRSVQMATSKLRSKTMAPSRQLRVFYLPALELQSSYPQPPLIKYGLEQTLRGPVLQGKNPNGWPRYLQAVVKNNSWRFTGERNVEKGDPEAEVRALLVQGAKANRDNDRDRGLTLLEQALAKKGQVAYLFGGDAAKCEVQIRLAFKMGIDDFVGAEMSRTHWVDYLPGWAPEGAAQKPDSSPRTGMLN